MRRIGAVLFTLLAAGAMTVLTGPPAQAVPGLALASAVSALDGTDTKSVSVACPAGTKPLGGGFFVSGGAGGRISVTRLEALSPSNTFVVTATEAGDGAPAAWRLHGYATCTPALAGLTYVSVTSASGSDFSGGATATCPAGTKVIGTGVRLLGDLGQVVVDDIQPNPALSSVTVRAYEDSTGHAGNWQVTAHATCAAPLAGQSLRTAATAPDHSTDGAVAARCPAGTRVHGLAGTITNAFGHAYFGGLYPTADLTSAVAVTIEQHGGFERDWLTRVFAICAA